MRSLIEAKEDARILQKEALELLSSALCERHAVMSGLRSKLL